MSVQTQSPMLAAAPSVFVGPFRLADVGQDDLVTRLVNTWETCTEATAGFALHIGGLRLRHDDTFADSLNGADVTYADGVAAVLLARRAGATSIERAPTTDIGWDVVHEIARRTGRNARVAMVGGTPGLAVTAGETIAAGSAADIVYAVDGYQESWDDVLEDLRSIAPDIIFVGLGMPLEAHWVIEHRLDLPPSLVLTCGGWFGFLAGHEKRAPQIAQRLGLEWIWRLAQQPRRLASRYLLGSVTLVRMMLKQERRKNVLVLPTDTTTLFSQDSSAA